MVCKQLLQFTPKQQRLLDELPKHGYSFSLAGFAAGYSKNYAQTALKQQTLKNSALCKAIDVLRTKITVESLDEIEQIKQNLDNIIGNEDTSTANKIRCLDIKCKIAGVYSEKRVYENSDRQRELDMYERQEAALISQARLKLQCHTPLPLHIVGDVIDSGTHTAPQEQDNSTETEDKQDGNKQDTTEL